MKASDDTVKTWLSALPDAERRIPLPWKSVDRVLDIVLWRPPRSKQVSHRRGTRILSEGDEEEDSERIRFSNLIFDQGEEPPAHLTETVNEWEDHGVLEKSDIDHVVWAFIKWEELGYDEGKTPFDSFSCHFNNSEFQLHGMLLLDLRKITTRVSKGLSIDLLIHEMSLYQSVTNLNGKASTTALLTVFENMYCKTLQSWSSVLLLILNSCRSR